MRTNLLIAFTAMVWAFLPMQDFSKARQEMVQRQIIKRGVSDVATLKAMRDVPRHLFVPASRQKNAYDDNPLPIGYGQTISQPYIVAFMTQAVRPAAHHCVLEIGTGSGYQAAVLSRIVKEVYTIEIVDELAIAARNRLNRLNYKNIAVKTDDGYYGWKEKGPFDAIVVTAAAEYVPPALKEQLKEGGRMIIPVGSPFMVQQLMLIEKKHNKYKTTSMMPVRFVPFTRSNKK